MARSADILGQDARGRRDPHPARLGPLQVDRVGADPVDGDDFERRQGIGDRIADSVATAGNDRADRRADFGDEFRRIARLEQAVDAIDVV